MDRHLYAMRLLDHKSVDNGACPKPGIYLRRKGESRVKGCIYVGTVVMERTQMKSNDTGTERKTGKHQDMEKGEEKTLDTNGLCDHRLTIRREVASYRFCVRTITLIVALLLYP